MARCVYTIFSAVLQAGVPRAIKCSSVKDGSHNVVRVKRMLSSTRKGEAAAMSGLPRWSSDGCCDAKCFDVSVTSTASNHQLCSQWTGSACGATGQQLSM